MDSETPTRSLKEAEIDDIYSARPFCFSKHTLESLFLEHKDLFQHYMLHATCKSTRYGLQPKAKMKYKSCRTYISTLSNVICFDSEFSVPLREILLETTEEQFIREQHLTFDKVKSNRRNGRLNIYQPAFRKLLEWLKHEAQKMGCTCDDCLQTCELLLCPDKQAEEQRSCCRNCGCGHHFTMTGCSTRTCHTVDAQRGSFTCLGRKQCMNCLRYFALCRYHRMIDIIKQRPEFTEAVSAGKLFVCNFCFVNKTIREQWLKEIRRPLELGVQRLETGIRRIAKNDISERKLLKEMREEVVRNCQVNEEDLLTHRQVATVMQTADENIDRITKILREKKRQHAQSFLSKLDNVLTNMCLHQSMEKSDRDIILAAAKYHVGNRDETMTTDDCGNVLVNRKRRKLTI